MSNSEKKVEILDRLIKAGSIDLKEALLLMDINTGPVAIYGNDLVATIKRGNNEK